MSATAAQHVGGSAVAAGERAGDGAGQAGVGCFPGKEQRPGYWFRRVPDQFQAVNKDLTAFFSDDHMDLVI